MSSVWLGSLHRVVYCRPRWLACTALASMLRVWLQHVQQGEACYQQRRIRPYISVAQPSAPRRPRPLSVGRGRVVTCGKRQSSGSRAVSRRILRRRPSTTGAVRKIRSWTSPRWPWDCLSAAWNQTRRAWPGGSH